MENKQLNKKAEWNAYFLGDSFLRIARYFRELHDEVPDQFAIVAQFVGISVRRAYDLAKIDRVFRDLGIEEGRLLVVGWSKLRVIARHINADNCEELLTLAETHSVHELSRLVRDGVPAESTRYVALRLTPEQYHIFASAVLAHGGIKSGRGIANMEGALIKALELLKP